MLEHPARMLQHSIGTEGEDSHPGNGESSPVTVQVGLDILVEDTVSTSDGFSLQSFSEVTRFFGQTLDFINWGSRVSLVESQEAFVRAGH